MKGTGESSGLFRGTAGERAARGEAVMETPVSPGEIYGMPPGADKIETGAHAFPCYDHVPKTIRSPLTNGGTLRAMDNHQLAEWLAKLTEGISAQEGVGSWGTQEFFNWLSEPADADGFKQ